MPEGAAVLTVEFKMNLLRPARGAVALARAEVLKPGRTLMAVRADVFCRAAEAGAEELAATMLATMMCVRIARTCRRARARQRPSRSRASGRAAAQASTGQVIRWLFASIHCRMPGSQAPATSKAATPRSFEGLASLKVLAVDTIATTAGLPRLS